MPRSLREAQKEYFGKAGISLLGVMLVRKVETSFKYYFYDIVVDNHVQDTFQVMSALEAVLPLIGRDHPTLKKAFIISDNASVFSSEVMAFILKMSVAKKCVFVHLNNLIESLENFMLGLD